mgnify:CR=1 FL=1
MNIAVACGLIILVLLVIMLLAGVPIAVALAVSSICAILPVLDTGAAVLTGAQRIFSGISVFSLLAIPFFILAGNIMNKGGIAIRLINFAKLFTGNIPGALAHTNAVANMLFGAISGSGTAAASAMGSIIGPIEEEEGYDRDFSAAANIATAPTGLLIPPSNVMITYSLVSGGTSVAALFMAGYIPGILWGLACMAVIYYFAKKKGYRSAVKYSFSEKVKVFFQAIPCLLMIVIVIGGIISGIFTATEGSVVAVVYSLILSLFFYKSIKVSELPKIFLDSAEMTGIIIFLIGVSLLVSALSQTVGANLNTLLKSVGLAMFDKGTMTTLFVTVLGLICAMTPLGKVPAVEELSSVYLYAVVSLLASTASVLDLLAAPMWVVYGFFILVVHVVLMFGLSKLFHWDLCMVSTASLANIGGAASAPIVASAYDASYAGIGVLMGILGAAIGNFAGLFCGYVLKMMS